jgi:hypothetical protein
MIAVRPTNGRLKGGMAYSIKEGRRIPEWLMGHLDVEALIKAKALKEEPKPKTKSVKVEKPEVEES